MLLVSLAKEVGTGWSGWNGAQPDGRCVCLC